MSVEMPAASAEIATAAEAPLLGLGEPAGARFAALGGILAAFGAASCCVVPFALFTLGVSGAWIGNLTALAPYQPIFAAMSVGLIAAGAIAIRRRAGRTCAAGSYCARPASDRIARIGLWTAAVLLALALAFPVLAPLVIEM